MFRKFLLLFCLMPLLVFSSGCDNRENELVVGMELKLYPFEYVDDGEYRGLSVDLAKALAERLGKELVIKDIQFSGLMTALQTGEIDLVISSMTKNEKRMESIDFSDPYVHMGLSILAGAKSGINSIEDILGSDRKVAVNTGTTGHLYAEKHLKKDQIVVLSTVTACVIGVVEGNYDAFLFDQVAVYNNWKAHPEATKAILKPFQEEDWAIGIRKGNDKLRKDVNAFLKDYKESGELETLGKKHLAEIQKELARLGIPLVIR